MGSARGAGTWRGDRPETRPRPAGRYAPSPAQGCPWGSRSRGPACMGVRDG
jgi:hypothetical protein